MQSLTTLLFKIAHWRAALLATFFYAVFLTQVMAPQAETMAATAGTWGAPDGHFFYTPDELYAAIGQWPTAAHDAYVSFRLGLDPLWAITYTLWLITLLGIGLRQSLHEASAWRQLILLPLIPMLADLCENILGIALVTGLPATQPTLAWSAAIVTALKWTTLAIAHLIMMTALALAAVRRHQ